MLLHSPFQWLAIAVGNLREFVINPCLDAIRQAHEIDIVDQCVTLQECPGKELERGNHAVWVVGRLRHDDEGAHRDWPGMGTWLVGEHFFERCAGLPRAVAQCGSESFAGRGHKFAIAILHLCVSQLVLCDIVIVDVADCAGGLLDCGYDAAAAFDLCVIAGPCNSKILAVGIFPGMACLAQVIGEIIGGAGTVLAHDRNDGNLRQRDTWIQSGHGRIVPFGDLARKNVGEDFARELQFTLSDPWQIDDWHDAGDRAREADHLECFQVLGGHGNVAGAKVDRFFLDLLDAGGRTYRLIAKFGIAGFAIKI